MDWQLIGALAGGIGIGTIIATVIQLIGQWKLEKYKSEREFNTWLRNKKLDAYSSLIKMVLFMGVSKVEKDEMSIITSGIGLLCQNKAILKALGAFCESPGALKDLDGHMRKVIVVADMLQKDLHATK